MEKILKLYTYIDGINDTPFPSEEYQVVTLNFRSDYKRMGGAPSITCTIMHPMCLDKLWTYGVYAKFNGERFFIKQIPSSSYDNTDARYKHDVELVSERVILDNVYVYDVVDSESTDDKPVSNSSKFTFFGTVNEFAQRLNQSLQYSGLDYTIVVDDGITSEGKLVSFENQFFTNALQEIYNIFELPYYFVGKVIHIGYTSNAITHTFKYGKDESLLSIQKQNANHKIVNRVTGVGSTDNIPYYYPNDYESKEVVEANGGVWINPQPNLMPSIYRETLGKERFYNALNDTYVNQEIDEYYKFENQYIKGQPREHIVNFENVKPSIVGIRNASNQRIDMFLEFAYDENDNDEFDNEGNYLHPYFFAKLRKFDGEYGFNLFDHAIDEEEMVISMTSGSCGACEFIIGVDDDTQKNIVQVDEYGNLKRDDKGNVIRSGTPQDRQNDTRNNEVWIALKKDINTFGVIMPNAEYKYRPSTNDTFVILHIDLPKAYILAAENNLKEQLIKYMSVNNVEKFNFSISFSRIFFAENPHILAQLDENARIQIEYDGIRHDLYVSSYSYNMSSDKALPEIKVELSDTISVQQNALQNAISEVKQDIMSSVGSTDFLKQGLKYFLRKDTNDRTRGRLSSDVGFEVGKYVSGASGAIVYQDKESGQTIGELDKLYVRMKAYFDTLEIVNVNTIGGKQILSPAGSIKCIGVEETSNAYRCYFLAEQDGEKVGNRWKIGDQAYSQIFNAKTGVSNKVSNTYYWRLVVGVTTDAIDFDGKQCHYIELSKTDCDNGSDIPMVGDVINHRGSRTDIDRMNFIEWSSVDAFSPNITLFHGVNSYSLDGKAYVDFGVDKTLNKAYMNVYGDMYVGDRKEEQYIRYENGKVTIKGKLEVGTTLSDGRDLEQAIKDAAPEGYDEFVEQVTKEFEAIRNEMDGAIDTWFGYETPTLSNYPAIDWITDSDKDAHLGDLFYANDGKAYRFQYTQEKGYHWATIEDSEVVKALELAQKALDTADGKRRVFIDTPYPPYDLGDLWAGGSDTPLKRCVKAKSENGSYSDSDWALADDSHAYADAVRSDLEQSISTTTSSLNSAIQNAESASKTYTDNAKQALQTSINELNNAKANVSDVYSKSEADGKISKAEKEAIDAANKQAQAAIELSETTIKAYADGVVDEEEAARIKQAQENLQAAKDYADQKAQEAFNEINGYEYLKLALKDAQSTEIDNGLVLTSLIQLRDKSGNIMSGINGLSSSVKLDKSIATWWGGAMNDLADYYIWDGKEWKPKSGVTIPTSIPSGLIRFDGTGYLAKGKFWWDNNGKIYADPTALFLMFDVDDEAKSLSTTILAMLDKQTEFANMWSVKTDKNGNKYLYSKYSLATQGGISMYSDATTLDIPSVYDGLPIDGDTIYWEYGSNGKKTVLKAKVGTEGAITEVTPSMIIEALGYTPYNSSNPSGYITSSALNGYATQDWVTKQGFLTQHQDLSGYQTKITSSSKLTASLVSGLSSVATSGKYDDLIGKPTLLSSFTDDIVSGKYLPLSGGTIDSTNANPLTINTNKTTIEVKLSSNNVIKSYIGWNVTDGVFFQEGEGLAYIGIQPNKTPYFYNGTRNTLWHSGNDGSDSGLDADLLDGKQPSELNVGSATQLMINYSYNQDINYPLVFTSRDNIGVAKNGAMYIDFSGRPTYNPKTDTLTVGNLSGNASSATKLVSGTTDTLTASGVTLKDTYGRKVYDVGSEWFAFGSTDVVGVFQGYDLNFKCGAATTMVIKNKSGNVGIGTTSPSYKLHVEGTMYGDLKMKTPRTIWGQNFDGTGNVSGTLSLNTSSIQWYNNASYGISCPATSVSARLQYQADDGHIFKVASGISSLIIDRSGNVGIGITNPIAKLHVSGDILGNSICVNNTDGSGNGISLYKGSASINFVTTYGIWFGLTSTFGTHGNVNGDFATYFSMSNDSGRGWIFRRSDKVRVASISKDGDVLVNGGITMYSDQRKKTILNHVELSLKQIANAPLIEHYYNTDEKRTTHVGSIAQYWYGLNDWFCKEDSEGYLTMEIQNAALASAISVARELDRYETKTDKTIKQLRKRISELEDEVERLKSA